MSVPTASVVMTTFPVGAATAYFVVNTLAVASAIALSTRQSVLKVWNENFLWSAPSYFVGAGAAAVAFAILDVSGHWLAPLAVALQFAQAIYLVGSVFQGIAYQPFILTLIGVQCALWSWCRREPVTASLLSAVAGLMVLGLVAAWSQLMFLKIQIVA